ncbi:hypothetical protein; putative secreted protein [Bradyrhizobium sp. ORS 278]|nr:hypothetical protein; putative secreted protein [Bradyrhizobium sp. ORS 278]
MRNQRRLAAIHALLAVILGACSVATMKSYEGKTVLDVILDYGPPSAAYDTGDGRRAFVWTMNYAYGLPAQATTIASVANYGNQSFYSASTLVSPGATFSQSCNYALFAVRKNGATDGPAAWQVVDFAKPRLDCL